MRRATSMIELIAVLAMMGMVALLFGINIRTTLSDVPNLQKLAQASRVVSGMLEQLQNDIDSAKSLPKSHAGKPANEKLILIELPQKIVSYEVLETQIVRKELPTNDPGTAGKTYNWPLGQAKMSFHNWEDSSFTYAVEVRRAVQYHKKDKTEDRLVNAHVFYLASMPGRREQQ